MKLLVGVLVSVLILLTIIAIVSNHLVLATIDIISIILSMIFLLLGDEED